MEDKEKMKSSFGEFKELKEAEECYTKCLDAKVEDSNFREYPSLKYALYNLLLWRTFEGRIKKIINDIEELKKKLNCYKGNKVNAKKEFKKLEEIRNKLIFMQKEAKEGYEFYVDYLTKLAKKNDVLNNQTMKSIYIKASEEIIKTQINYYMKYEKNFLIFNDNINQLKNIFNI